VVKDQALAELEGVVGSSGLLDAGSSAVVMVSGGADSACVAAAIARRFGAEAVHALHYNYGLRPEADDDMATCRRLCAALRIDLHVERPRAALTGNLQAAARALRYEAAERLRDRTGSDLIVTGHTRTDVAETVVYRLAASPGSRALLGLAPRNGRVVRPLLALERARVRELARAAELPFADDASNADPQFARNRIRTELLPVLTEINPAAVRNICETRAELAEEAQVMERVVLEALGDAGADAAATSIATDALAAHEPGLRRLALRALAERAAGRPVALGRGRAAEITRLAASSEGGEIELGGGLTATCEAGRVSFRTAVADAAPDPVALRLPGRVRMADWEVRAEIHPGPVDPAGPELATLDAESLAGRIEVRTWRDGDRIRPLGMSGTKSLQDLFTDRGVPRSVRRTLPVVTVDGEVAWVAGVAVSESFRLDPATEQVAVLSARSLE
jgi:tRNA(Ile)-lysidine synthase